MEQQQKGQRSWAAEARRRQEGAADAVGRVPEAVERRAGVLHSGGGERLLAGAVQRRRLAGARALDARQLAHASGVEGQRHQHQVPHAELLQLRGPCVYVERRPDGAAGYQERWVPMPGGRMRGQGLSWRLEEDLGGLKMPFT